jgi:hypothetical protein
MAANALRYINSCGIDLFLVAEALSACAEVNRTAEICSGTLQRLLEGRPVSDRYVLGLAWLIKELREMADSTPMLVSVTRLLPKDE